MAVLPRYSVDDLTDAIVYYDGTNALTEHSILGVNHGWSLREIAKKAISILQIETKNKNNETVYDDYCGKLDSKIGGGQYYCSEVGVSQKSTVDSVMAAVKEIIPIQNKSLEAKCEETILQAFQGVDLSFTNGIFYASDKKEIKINEFIVMQVFQTGHCIDIIPTFIEFFGVAEGQRVLLISTAEASARIKYRQTRYTLNRGHIHSIISKLDEGEEKCSF